MNEEYGYYLILLGGTGARCGEIFIHMCANGYFPARRVHLLYIDSDLRNGNAERMRKLYRNYCACREKYVIKSDPLAGFFRTEIDMIEENPVHGVKRFSDLASMNSGNLEQMKSTKSLMRALYSDEEYDMQISEGFFARPGVGAALFAANMASIMDKYMVKINEDQMAGKKIKIFMIGSVFGGTGASSLPTIAKYIRKVLFGDSKDKHIAEKLKIGASIVLPYFSFARKENAVDDGGIEVDARIFSMKTRTALEYYDYLEENENRTLFDAVYLLGHEGQEVRGWYGTAGDGQRNLPHITEFYTAMAAVSFFGDGYDNGKYFAELPQDKIDWNCFHDRDRCVLSFLVMMRFAITMESLILEELFERNPWESDEWRLGKHAEDIPWYYDFINGRTKVEQPYVKDAQKLKAQLSDVSEYCIKYVRWFAELFVTNLEKLDCPDQISFRIRKERKTSNGDIEDDDLVNYLDLFAKNLVIRQHVNNEISTVYPVGYPSDKKKNIWDENLKYIRENADKLFDKNYINSGDKKVKDVGFEQIWSRINALGYNHMRKDFAPIRNLDSYSEISLEESIRNLVNAVYIACLI